ncbi:MULTISPECIES: pyrimidine dimer DNA glycosylase/endonuclease V [unclassified Wolbachia]|uniref:pyrimidine dimer DNA glycosylase/endonuclease V n=1 Tax=unclassified Wolbachia TaxID=2640676 RepID=UPI0022271582|nr:pyrimidine dimer DNA glycosylase/endonuclease V [Wolbachia endosymbiont (group A) of Sphecodes monilicornis]
MNIFVLDENPEIAAKMLCDKHIVKMPLETAQLLSNVFSIALKVPNPFVSVIDQDIEVPYKLTHSNHPCSLWARQSKGNFCWLIEYGKELCKEYTWRYKRKHKSEKVIDWCDSNKDLLIFRSTDMQTFIQALPDQYKCSSAVEAYRRYYLKEKMRFAKWENGREAPDWIICYTTPQLIQLINREAIQIGHEKGREEGEKQAKIAVAKNSLKAGVSIDVIAEITGFSVDYIEKIQEKKF